MNKTHNIKIPGLMDAHVHLRVPGGEHKEDFRSGTAAALAGGFTTVMAMPNTKPPLVTLDQWTQTNRQAQQESLCDVGLFCGATLSTLDELSRLGRIAPALKVYLDPTYGQLKVDGIDELRQIAAAWPREKVIALHAEGASIQHGIQIAEEMQRPIHFCHVSRKQEIEWIAAAKVKGLPVTCEVTPHHLFLTQADAERLGTLGDMRPRLASQRDVDALWEHIGSTIDVVATDHAPHTLKEKADAQNPPPGVPGLESVLPLMLTAVAQGRLNLERVLDLLHTNPRRIYGVEAQKDTWVEVDMNARYTFPEHGLYTKCAWSPFSGMEMQGRILRVVLRGVEVVQDGVVLNYSLKKEEEK